MDPKEQTQLAEITLAPYIQKATALIGHQRKVGGNQFRHAMATLAILIDYHYSSDAVLLKASIIHDLFEECQETKPGEITAIDSDGPKVLKLVLEVTRNRQDESKQAYLKRLRDKGSERAKILKVADRISNLTDLNTDIFEVEYISRYLDDTEHYIYPIAQEINRNMALEIRDLMRRRNEKR